MTPREIDIAKGKLLTEMLTAMQQSAQKFADANPEPQSEFRQQVLKLVLDMSKGQGASDIIAMLAVVTGQLTAVATGSAAGVFNVATAFEVEQSIERANAIGLEQMEKFFRLRGRG